MNGGRGGDASEVASWWSGGRGVGDDDRRHPNSDSVVSGRRVARSASLPPRQAVAGTTSRESRSPPQRVAQRGNARIAAEGGGRQ